MKPGTIVVSGSMAQRAGYGGHAWVFLQYLLGFRRLGFEVLFLDRFEQAMSPAGRVHGSEHLAALDQVMEAFEIPYAVLTDRGAVIGPDRSELRHALSESSLLLNVMGFLDDEDLLAAAPLRVFLDIDPGFGQMWHELRSADVFGGHDVYLTVGANMGRPGCSIPTCGIDWVPTRPPVVLEEWPVQRSPGERITTVGSWRGPFDAVEFDGRRYGLRVHEFRRFIDLPARTGERFDIALEIDPDDSEDRRALVDSGWNLVDPGEAAADYGSYREFVQRSRAELMVAKGVYVQTNSGWFSDRSACYLASGRPVVAQDTGLASVYEVGKGLLTFATLEEAVEGVARVRVDYDAHAAAARSLAEQHFDSDVVLGGVLKKLGIGSPGKARLGRRSR